MRTAILLACALAVGLATVNRAAAPSPGSGNHGRVTLTSDDSGGQAAIRARLASMKASRLADLRTARASATLSRTIRVDCTKGQSIQAAIDKNAGSIIVEIRGICSENVLIDGREVTLRGSDPTVDGIRGVAMTGATLAAVGRTTRPRQRSRTSRSWTAWASGSAPGMRGPSR